jgi:hypothetical protein
LVEEFLVGRLAKLFHHGFFSYFSKGMGIQQEGEIAEKSETSCYQVSNSGLSDVLQTIDAREQLICCLPASPSERCL